jgi:hypothetical protein
MQITFGNSRNDRLHLFPRAAEKSMADQINRLGCKLNRSTFSNSHNNRFFPTSKSGFDQSGACGSQTNRSKQNGSDANQTRAHLGIAATIAATIDFFPRPNLESIIQALEPHSINGTRNTDKLHMRV